MRWLYLFRHGLFKLVIEQTLVDFPFSCLNLWRKVEKGFRSEMWGDLPAPHSLCFYSWKPRETSSCIISIFSECINCLCLITGSMNIMQAAVEPPYVLAEPLAVVSAGEVKVSVEVKVIWGKFRHPQDRFLTLLFDWMSTILLLHLPH